MVTSLIRTRQITKPNFFCQLGPDRSDRSGQTVWPVEPVSTVLGPTSFKPHSLSLSLNHSSSPRQLSLPPEFFLSQTLLPKFLLPTPFQGLGSFKLGSRITLSMCSFPGWRGFKVLRGEEDSSKIFHLGLGESIVLGDFSRIPWVKIIYMHPWTSA